MTICSPWMPILALCILAGSVSSGNESVPTVIKILNSGESASKLVFNVPGTVAITDGFPSGAISSEVKVLRVDGKLPGDPGYVLK